MRKRERRPNPHLGSRGLIHWFVGLTILLAAGCADEALEATGRPPATVDLVAAVTPPAVDDTNSGDGITLAWTYDTGGPINHPPLPLLDVVIAVPSQGPVLALESATGALRWRYDAGKRIWDRAYASDGVNLFVGIEGGELVALNLENGQVTWQKELGINAQTPLTVSDRVLYVPTTFVGPGLLGDPDGRAKLFALNPADGTEIWSFESNNYILQTPFRQDATVYVAGSYSSDVDVDEGGHMRLYALSAADGSEQWSYESVDGFPKQLYATSAVVAYVAYQDFAIGVSTRTGEILWRKDTGNWVPSLTGAGDTIYFGSANTIVHALNVDNGEPVWQHNIEEGTFNYVLGAPVYVGGDLIFLTQHGNIVALSANDGSLKWQFDAGVASRTGLSVRDNWIFLGDEDGVVYGYSGVESPQRTG